MPLAPSRASRIEFHFEDPRDGSVLDVDLVAVPASEWADHPESTSTAWLARRLGELVIAVRVRR
jgi:hypothetical protein